MLEQIKELDYDKCLDVCRGRFRKKQCPFFAKYEYTKLLFSIIPIGKGCVLYKRFSNQRQAYLNAREREKNKTP